MQDSVQLKYYEDFESLQSQLLDLIHEKTLKCIFCT